MHVSSKCKRVPCAGALQLSKTSPYRQGPAARKRLSHNIDFLQRKNGEVDGGRIEEMEAWLSVPPAHALGGANRDDSPTPQGVYDLVRNRAITSASLSLIPSNSAISATEALRKRSIEPKCLSNICLRFSLTPGQSSKMLSATRFFIRSWW